MSLTFPFSSTSFISSTSGGGLRSSARRLLTIGGGYLLVFVLCLLFNSQICKFLLPSDSYTTIRPAFWHSVIQRRILASLIESDFKGNRFVLILFSSAQKHP